MLNAIINYVKEQKEKLSDVEIQAKKAEAAQRRKMQVEKAEKEQQVYFCASGSELYMPVLRVMRFYNIQLYRLKQ